MKERTKPTVYGQISLDEDRRRLALKAALWLNKRYPIADGGSNTIVQDAKRVDEWLRQGTRL